MRAYKIENKTEQIFDILKKEPTNPIKVSDLLNFSIKAHICYKYASNIKLDKSNTPETINLVDEWLNTIPKQPTDKSFGFPKGSVEKFCNDSYGSVHEQVIDRVIRKRKNPILPRPEKFEYADTSRTFETDQEILDS